MRRARIASAVIAGLVLVALLAWALHVPDFKSAAASGQANATDTPEKVFDGDTKTSWYLPDNQNGWIELTLGRPGRVRALRVEANNAPWNDREAKETHVACYL